MEKVGVVVANDLDAKVVMFAGVFTVAVYTLIKGLKFF